MRAAVIDLGTNTFHLIIADLSEKDAQIVYKTTVPVLLGQGRINENMIIPEAFERGIRTLREFNTVIQSYNTEVVNAIATSAVRSALNGAEFVAEAKLAGIEIRVISGDEEADFIYAGVRATGIIKGTSLIMDIGGGSTEFIICNDQGLLWKKSYDIGAARLMQAYFHSDPLSDADHARITAHLDNTVDDLKAMCARHQPGTLIGSAGAFESFATLLNNGDDIGDIAAASLNVAAYEALAQRLISSTHAERTGMKGLISLRVDMIVIAAILTNYMLKHMGIGALRMSTYDLKMGVLHTIREQLVVARNGI
jgi:exopolyphosphatase/guanosine-5'-triphosphate,3'-diphosphate pyrophosphatase